jgi:hypothetical protein
MHNWIVLKTILKFTLKLTSKQLLHVSVQSPSSESALFELAKVTVVKITLDNKFQKIFVSVINMLLIYLFASVKLEKGHKKDYLSLVLKLCYRCDILRNGLKYYTERWI